MTECPVCGMMVDEATAPSLEYEGNMYFFMNETHKKMFEGDPVRYGQDDGSNADPWEHLETRSGGCCG
jgi:YHS domain-containing protein